MKYFFINACILIGTILGSSGKDVSINGLNCVIPETWSASKPEQGTDSVYGKIQTDKEGFAIGWELGPVTVTGDIVEQRSKDGDKIVIREELKNKTGVIVGKMLIVVKTGGTYGAYARVSGFNFHAYCKDREQMNMFAKFIRSNFQEPKTIGDDKGKK
jgi:hypothetical protein